jgi:hypothetical protein
VSRLSKPARPYSGIAAGEALCAKIASPLKGVRVLDEGSSYLLGARTNDKAIALCVLAVLASRVAMADSFTLDSASSLGRVWPLAGTTSDILSDGPVGPSLAVLHTAMGLQANDVVDAISDGFDLINLNNRYLYFSVTRNSQGAPGSGVAGEFGSDTPPGNSPGHASDIFLAGGNIPAGTNLTAPSGLGWTLGSANGDEANANLLTPSPGNLQGDNVNAYELSNFGTNPSVFFSLAAGSPTLAALGASPADILAIGPSTGNFALHIYMTAAQLGVPRRPMLMR